MTLKKKFLNILLLLFAAIMFFKIATFVVCSYAYPQGHTELKTFQAANP